MSPTGEPWVVNVYGKVFTLLHDDEWVQQYGTAKGVTVGGSDSQVWSISMYGQPQRLYGIQRIHLEGTRGNPG